MEQRILYVTTNNDISKKNGGGLATLAYYNAVSNLYPEKVDLMHMPIFDDNHPFKGKCIEITPQRNKIKILISILSGRFYMYNFIKSFLSEYSKNYNLCIINGGVYAGSVIKLFKDKGIKVVVIHHNYERNFHLENKTINSLKGLYPFQIIRNERNAYLNADLNLFLTNQDILKFKDTYGECNGKVALLGCFDPYDTSLPHITTLPHDPALVISGSMDIYQTVDGIIDFYNNYYQSLNNIYPEMKIIITGRNPSESIMQIGHKNADKIKIIPNPENILDIVKKGSVFCCPTKLGGGIKLRIMDGLRLGMPVIVHERSARGYDAFFQKPYFKVYHDKNTFRNGMSELVQLIKSNEIDRNKIQQDYLDYFSFSAGMVRMKDALSLINF